MQQYPASHAAAGLQHSCDLLATTYQHAWLIVNIKKTEVLAQSMNMLSAEYPTLTVHGDLLNDVHQFTYLGSILTSDCDLNNEVNQRVKLASVAFGRLSHRVGLFLELSLELRRLRADLLLTYNILLRLLCLNIDAFFTPRNQLSFVRVRQVPVLHCR